MQSSRPSPGGYIEFRCLLGDHFFLGLTVESQGRRGHIPYLDVQREGFLEYDIVQALNGLNAAKTPKVCILSPLLPLLLRSQSKMAFPSWPS